MPEGHALYQLSYNAGALAGLEPATFVLWLAWMDSNHRPAP